MALLSCNSDTVQCPLYFQTCAKVNMCDPLLTRLVIANTLIYSSCIHTVIQTVVCASGQAVKCRMSDGECS